MVHLCKEAGVPIPVIKERQKGFQITFSKDIYTEEYLQKLGLNERQMKAVMYVKEKGRITNKEYQELTKISKPMTTIDLKQLVNMKVFKKIGTRGRGTVYTLIG